MPYIGVSPQFGVRKKHTYTATAGQTSFSGAGSEGATLSYKDSNFVDVYQNGVKLGDADYTSTSGTAIVLAQGASVDDLVEIIVFDAFSAADTVSKADGGTFDGNVTMAGTLGVTGASTLTGALSAKGGAVFNEDSADVDFRVEGNGEANLLLVDAGEDNVKIGDNAGNYAKLSLRNEAAGAQERGLYVEVAPASGTSPNNVAVFAATNANLTTPVVRIHHESPTANQIMLQTTTTGSNTVKFSVDEDGEIFTNSGVYFGAVADANLLDDYEEGTWTPTYTTDGTGFGAITHDIQDGKYTKIGRTVTLTCRLRTSSVTHGSVSGSLSVSGAPFTPASGSGLNLYWVGFNSSFQSSQAPNVVRVSEGITNMELYELPSAGGYSFNDALAGTDLATGSNSNYVYFCLTYMSA